MSTGNGGGVEMGDEEAGGKLKRKGCRECQNKLAHLAELVSLNHLCMAEKHSAMLTERDEAVADFLVYNGTMRTPELE